MSGRPLGKPAVIAIRSPAFTQPSSTTRRDAAAISSKYDLVNSYALRGAGLWALGYDGTRTELYQAIADKFITDTIPPKIAGSTLSSTLVSPNADGRLDILTASKLGSFVFLNTALRSRRSP